MPDPFNLQRFVDAQADVYQGVTDELRAGRKESHWMWFFFPQLADLGQSAMAKKYGIANLEEARAYLAHPVLGKRLRECTEMMLAIEGKSAFDVLGAPDDLKFRSCMTLFHAAGQHPQWTAALHKYFGSKGDPATLDILGRQA